MSHDQTHAGHNTDHAVAPFLMHQQVRIGENSTHPAYKGAFATFLEADPATGQARVRLYQRWMPDKRDNLLVLPIDCLEAIRCECHHREVNEEGAVPLAVLLYHASIGDANYLALALKRGERGLFCCMPCFVRLEQTRLAHLLLSTATIEMIKSQDYQFHPFCSHCTVFSIWRVQGKGVNGKTILALSVCEDDIVRYQPEKWREWVWEVEYQGYLLRGPCCASTVQTPATSTLSLDVGDLYDSRLRSTLTVPWHQVRPFAPVDSTLWQAFSSDRSRSERSK